MGSAMPEKKRNLKHLHARIGNKTQFRLVRRAHQVTPNIKITS